MNKILQDRVVTFDTEHFDYSGNDPLVLVPKYRLEGLLNVEENSDSNWADKVTTEDIKKWNKAEEEFKRGKTISLDIIREKYGL